MTASVRHHRIRQAAFSLVEALVTSFIFVTLLVAVYGALGESLSFTGLQNTYVDIQTDARKALDRMSNELRMTGWVACPLAGGPHMPYIFANGIANGYYATESHAAAAQHVKAGTPAFGDITEVVFRVPHDNDGNGFLTSAATGAIEWSTFDVSYVVLTDASGVNTLYRRQDGVITDVLARYVERMTISTIDTDPGDAINEVVITIYMARPMYKGQWLEASISSCITMRNVEDTE